MYRKKNLNEINTMEHLTRVFRLKNKLDCLRIRNICLQFLNIWLCTYIKIKHEGECCINSHDFRRCSIKKRSHLYNRRERMIERKKERERVERKLREGERERVKH